MRGRSTGLRAHAAGDGPPELLARRWRCSLLVWLVENMDGGPSKRQLRIEGRCLQYEAPLQDVPRHRISSDKGELTPHSLCRRFAHIRCWFGRRRRSHLRRSSRRGTAAGDGRTRQLPAWTAKFGAGRDMPTSAKDDLWSFSLHGPAETAIRGPVNSPPLGADFETLVDLIDCFSIRLL